MTLDEVEIFAKCLLPHLNDLINDEGFEYPYSIAETKIPQLTDKIRLAIKDRTELQLKQND